MTIVLKGDQRNAYPEYFDKLFRLRHDIFVKGRGWSLPSSKDCERDQYDTDEAYYFLDLSEEGAIEGSVRLTPTVKSSLLADYFPHLVENGVSPRGPDIYEATRYIVLPTKKSRGSIRAAKTRLLTSMLEWALSRKLSFLQTVIDTGTLSSFVEISPRTSPLGLSHPYGGGRSTPGGGDCMAFRWPVTLEMLEDIRGYGDLGPQKQAA
jgi:acyl-homoserine lactone synthase